jgi:diguanylate cyclase (GGDEF)-like protein
LDFTDDTPIFASDAPPVEEIGPNLPPWPVLIVDDEPGVHEATEFALQGALILGRALEFAHAYSAGQALAMLRGDQVFAVILLDVVMETTTAGLDIIGQIRAMPGRASTRIILRTGQPGHAPDIDTVRRYDINDYQTKSELTRTRLYVAMSTAIRSYTQIEGIAASQRFLESVMRCTQALITQPDLREFAQVLLGQAAQFFGQDTAGLACVITSHGKTAVTGQVWAATQGLAGHIGRPVADIQDPATLALISRCLAGAAHQIEPSRLALHLSGSQPGPCCVVVLDSPQIGATPAPLIELLCNNIALAADRVALTERLRRQAYHDTLVDLPNRSALVGAIDRCIADNDGQGQLLALFDIDQFAEINDTLGHQYADRVLMTVARRLASHGHEGVLTARVGTDNFAMLGPTSMMQSSWLGALFDEPFVVDGNEHSVSAALGLVNLSDASGQGADRLKDASIAVKRAKSNGCGQTAWFTPMIGHETRERAAMLRSLREAFAFDRLFPVYQPQFNLATGRIIGFEALLRWRTEDGRFVPPDTFIPIAESSGLIISLGTWVLRMALRSVADLRRSGLDDFHMAVNVSVVQFRHPDFIATVDAALLETGTDPRHLELEITESVAMVGAQAILETFAALKSRGIKLAIDDFGTGFSSLSYLDRLPVDRIKIDKSFVSALDTGLRGERVAEMMIPLGRQLGMKVLAEGVETEHQIARLRALNCDEGQGYLWARPMPLADLLHWLQQRANLQHPTIS